MRLIRYWSWPLERAIHLLIPGWLDAGSPEDWRSRLIFWAWLQGDRRLFGQHAPSRARLEAVIACEQGRPGHAPPGWEPTGGPLREWRRELGDGVHASVSGRTGGDARWQIVRRGDLCLGAEGRPAKVLRSGTAPDKLAAMEAADRAVEL